MKNYTEQPWVPGCLASHWWEKTVHNLMSDDPLRAAEYHRAIAQVIREGDVVLDLGGGTGILSQWALEVGAGKVYAIDTNAETLSLASDRIKTTGHGGKFVPIDTVSYDAILPEKVDVIVSEIMGNLGDNDNSQFILADAYQRLAKPHCRSIPLCVRAYLVPISAGRAHGNVATKQIATLNSEHNIHRLLKISGVESVFNLYYDTIIPGSAHLSSPQLVCEYRDRWQQYSVYSKQLDFRIEKDGLITGFKGYFIADLSEHEKLDLSGDRIKRRITSDGWRHVYLPIRNPIRAVSGDRLSLRYSKIEPPPRARVPHIYRWEGQVFRSEKVVGRFDHCLDEGMIGNPTE